MINNCLINIVLIKKNLQNLIIFFVALMLLSLSSTAQNKNKIVDSLLHWMENHRTVDSQYIITLHRISYQLSETDIKKSFAYYEKVVAISDSLNYTYGKSLAQINLGLFFYGSANFDASNKAFFKAIDYAESCGALRLKAVSLNNIGDNLKTLKDYEKCRQYVNEAILLNTSLQAWRGVAINYELLQLCDIEEKLYQLAKEHLDKGMPFALKSNESYILSSYYLGYGKLKAIANNTDSATYYFAQAMEKAKSQNHLKNEFLIYIAKAEYLKNLKSAKRIILLDSALKIAKEIGFLKGISDAAYQLSKVYDERNNKDSALFFYRIFFKASDTLFSENNKRNVIIKESEWRLKRKEIENAHLLELSKLQKKDIVIKNGLLITLFIALLLVVGIAFFITKNSDVKKKRTESLLKQKITEIQMQVLRAQMNPHFIFNSLNSIENFMMKNEKRLASDYLNKFTRLIRTILDSSLNELIPIEKDMEALQLYIDLQQLRFNNKFIYETTIQTELLKGDYKVPSLIIQPFVENAIEHGIAHSERNDCIIIITAALKNDHILYTIEDNGIGRLQSSTYNQQNKPHHKSVGLSITTDRIHIFNKSEAATKDVTITDLYDTENKPAGTIISVKIKIL